MSWSKRPVEWIEEGVAHISVVFTWDLPRAYSRCAWLRAQGYRVLAGGPAVMARPDYLAQVAEIGADYPDAVRLHNPLGTFTSRGCIRQCAFCNVHRVEGGIRELPDWPVRPIVCDANLLACSQAHFDRVIDRLKPLSGVDFNQGLDAQLVTSYHASRLAELRIEVVRLSWDDVNDEPYVMRAIEILRRAGFGLKRIRVYVLLGYADGPDDVLYRLETLKAMGIRPNPQRFEPINALRRNQYVAPGWTHYQLGAFMRYWSRLRWLEHIPFAEFKYKGVAV